MGFQQLGFLSIPQGTTRLWWQVVCVILNTQRDESYFRKLNHPSRPVWFPQDMPVCQCKLLFGFVHFVILAAGFGLQFNASLPPGLIQELSCLLLLSDTSSTKWWWTQTPVPMATRQSFSWVPAEGPFSNSSLPLTGITLWRITTCSSRNWKATTQTGRG